ncbi:MAG: aldo/keto reductase [Chloroflexota bacterium]|jgi:aryl-alcohol dehydrogenase-like predicted oxidoreductase|nr:aldo/keto reductase [Chloroflexota bacterium]
MEYRPYGRTGVKVSKICLGCMNFGGKTNPNDSYAIIDRAIDDGINFLDTANVYTKGRSEEVTGEALKRNGKRQRIFLATKVYNVMDETDPMSGGNTRRHIIEQCDASLRRLQTDYIDLYQLHRPQSSVPIDETLQALDDLVRAGKVRYIGTTTFAAWQLMEAVMTSRDLHLNRFVSEQPPYNILDRRIERELVPFSRTYGIGLMPWSPLAGGMLTGKYDRNATPPEGTRVGDMYLKNPAISRRWNDNALDVVDALMAYVEARGGCTLSQFAIAWCMSMPGVTSPIIGPRTMQQYEDNMKALDVTLTPADFAKVDELVRPGHMVSPFYEADFGPHLHHI